MSQPTVEPPLGETPTRVRWLVFWLACGMSFLLYLHRYTWGFVKVQVAEEFGWDKGTLGWLDSAFMVTYAAGQIPGGMLGDWFGPRGMLTAICVVWSLAMGGSALAPGVNSMAWVRGLFGLAQSGCYPNLSKLTKVWFPYWERTMVQGLVSSFFGRMGGAASFLLIGTLLLGWAQLPWRTALGWLTAVGALYAAVFCIFFRNSPRNHPWSNAAEAELVTEGDPAAGIVTRSLIDWGRVFRSRDVWALLFMQFTCAFVDNFFSSWMPLYLSEVKHVEAISSGWMSALPLFGGACGGMLAGGFLQSWLIHKTGNRRWSRSSIGLVGNLMAGVCLYTSLLFDRPEAIAWTFFCLKFFADWAQPAGWGTITDMGGRNAASLFALVNTSGSLAGFIAGPLIGFTVDYFSQASQSTASGWNALFVSIGFVYVASALSWLFIDCTKTIDGEETASPNSPP